MQSEIEKDQQIEKLVQVQNIIKKYVNGEEDPSSMQQSSNNISLQSSSLPIQNVVPQNDSEPVTICAKDVILQPFVFSLDHYDDHNIAQHN